jgi:cysteine desulfurase
MGIYLDYNATAPINTEVIETMMHIYKDIIGNADSRTHDYGENARQVVENARKQVAELLGVHSDEIFFTSGATESNNIALQGLREYAESSNKKHIITTAIEHKAVLETAKHLASEGFEVDFIAPDESGRINVDQVLKLIRDDTLLVSIMHVNNETGIIQPVNELGELLAEKKILFHIDATQSCGKLVEEIQKCKYNMLSFSAHKLQGPQGIGVLVLKKERYKLPPVKAVYYGGQQEKGIRPGTTPVALVAGLGKACEISLQNYKKNNQKNKKIKDLILNEFAKSNLDFEVNGDQEHCINTTLNISIKGVVSEALMLSSKEFCGISNGSACTSKSYSLSYVLKAMGLPDERIENSIRISWGPDLSEEEIKDNIDSLIEVASNIAG